MEEFITSLHTLSACCDFGTLKHDFIRDRLVVGIHDETLSERMQFQRDLTLERAITLAKQSDKVKRQNPQI